MHHLFINSIHSSDGNMNTLSQSSHIISIIVTTLTINKGFCFTKECHTLQVLVFVVAGPVALVCKAAESMLVAVRTVWQGAKPLGRLARSASGLVRTTSLAATTSGASMADVSHQVGASLVCYFTVSPLCILLSCVFALCDALVSGHCLHLLCASLFCVSPACISSARFSSIYLLCAFLTAYLLCKSYLCSSSVHLLCASLLLVWLCPYSLANC